MLLCNIERKCCPFFASFPRFRCFSWLCGWVVKVSLRNREARLSGTCLQTQTCNVKIPQQHLIAPYKDKACLLGRTQQLCMHHSLHQPPSCHFCPCAQHSDPCRPLNTLASSILDFPFHYSKNLKHHVFIWNTPVLPLWHGQEILPWHSQTWGIKNSQHSIYSGNSGNTTNYQFLTYASLCPKSFMDLIPFKPFNKRLNKDNFIPFSI